MSAGRKKARPATLLDEKTATRVSSLFKALADPTRLRLIGALAAQERCVHELTTIVDMEQSAVSHQLRILRDRQLVRPRKEGRHVFYALHDEHVSALLDLVVAHIEHEGSTRGENT